MNEPGTGGAGPADSRAAQWSPRATGNGTEAWGESCRSGQGRASLERAAGAPRPGLGLHGSIRPRGPGSGAAPSLQPRCPAGPSLLLEL